MSVDKDFHRKLYEELLEHGYAHVHLFKMTLRMALLSRYGSPEAVDQELGEGTYRGVQQVYGGLSSWRKPWSHVRNEWKARYIVQRKAIDALSEAVDQCRALGVPEDQIQLMVQKPLINTQVMPLKAAPNLSTAL